jgi:hypothetical protein
MKPVFIIISTLAAMAVALPANAEPEAIVAREDNDSNLSKRQCGDCRNGKRTCWFCTPAGGCGASSWNC